MNFFAEYLHQPKIVGAVVPSSRFLTEKMLKPVDFKTARILVELGAGTGVMTRAILNKMHSQARLAAFEINPSFVQELRTVRHPRFTLIDASAERLTDHIQNVDVIVSSLPLMAFPKRTVKRILCEVKDALKPGGLFIQYQYSLKSHALLKKHFSDVTLDFTPLNIPPAFVYQCRK